MNNYKIAPKGFTEEQWKTFIEDGIIILENSISDEYINKYIDAIDRHCNADPRYQQNQFYGPENIVTEGKIFSDLIDNPLHVGFAYDVYGDLLKLHLSQFFVRPTGSSTNSWHADGARVVPYGVYTGDMPMQIKVAYWLTDLPRPKMGNFVYLPGSHRHQRISSYRTDEVVAGEKILCVKRGTITIMHCNLWHRVDVNESIHVRKNIFLAYCPSWVCEADRLSCDEAWLSTLTREQRVIMRSYQTGYARTRPPIEDFPLFLDREYEGDSYVDSEKIALLSDRKRKVAIEGRLNIDKTKV